MKIRRKILKIRSRFYYYLLAILGSGTMLLFTRCQNRNADEELSRLRDSIADANHRQDSIARADSISHVAKEQARLDSIHQADSLAKIRKKPKTKPQKPHPFLPSQPAVDYGVLPYDHPSIK